MSNRQAIRCRLVAPLAGAWIEILLIRAVATVRPVAPLAGAWIEIEEPTAEWRNKLVAPLAGAWIEIFYYQYWREVLFESLPSRERGLK